MKLSLPSPSGALSSVGKLGNSSAAMVLGAANSLAGGALVSAVANSPIGKGLLAAGWKYAATGGQTVQGVLAWFMPDGSPKYFKFPMNPSDIQESLSPEWADIKVPGQNRPVYQFINGGERELTFTLHFFYDNPDRRTITRQLDELRSLTQRPYVYSTGAASGPPPVYLYFGQYIQGQRFIVSKLNIKVFDLFDPAFLLPLRAEVEVSLKEALDPALTTENDPRKRLNVRSVNAVNAIVGAIGNPF